MPAGREVIANGELVGDPVTAGGKTTWRWAEGSPMASYLATATNGEFLTEFRSANGLPFYDAVDPNTRRLNTDPPNPTLAFQRLDPEPEIVSFFSSLYGAYPFRSAGGIVDWAPDVGYALESQSRPNYDRIPSAATVVHEISHQWFGDAVTPAYWPDIWLNEGFATWSEWIYDEMHGGPSRRRTGSTTSTRSPRTIRTSRTSGSRRRPHSRIRASSSTRRSTTEGR